MRVVTYSTARGARAGIEAEYGVIDAWNLLGEPGGVDPPGVGAPGPAAVGPSVRALIASGRLADLETSFDSGDDATDATVDPEILAPIPDPAKIICIGLNYASHAAEAGI